MINDKELREIPKPNPVSAIKQYAEQFRGTLTGQAFQDLFEHIESLQQENQQLRKELFISKSKIDGLVQREQKMRNELFRSSKLMNEENQQLREKLKQTTKIMHSATADNERIRRDRVSLRTQLEQAVEIINERMWEGDADKRAYCVECFGYQDEGHINGCTIDAFLSHIQGKEKHND